MTDQLPTILGAELPALPEAHNEVEPMDIHYDVFTASQMQAYARAAIAADRASRAAGQPVAMGCHCDLEPGQKPDGCVLDNGRPDDCARTRSGNITRREDCDEWRPIQFSAPQSPTLAPEACRVAGERGKKWHAALSAAGAYAQSCQGFLATPSTSAWMALQEALDALAAPAPVAQAVVGASEYQPVLEYSAEDIVAAETEWFKRGYDAGVARAALTASRPEASAAQPALAHPSQAFLDEADQKLAALAAKRDERAERLGLPAPALYPLPDDLYPDSKDWLSGDYAARVEWLHTMYEARKADVERMESAPSQVVSEASPDVAKMVETLTKVRYAIHENRLRWMTNDSPKACHEMNQAEIDLDDVIDALGAAATQASPDVAKMVAHATTAAHNLARQHLSTDLGKLINLINDLGAAATQARAAASEPLSVSEREVKP